MHLLRSETRSLDETAEAIDLAQTPAELVFLSFSDSDLAGLARAWERAEQSPPSLRLANLSALRHPFSVDRYVERVIAKARFVVVRLLGGLDYWRYGVEELSRAAKMHGFSLVVVPGDGRQDARLDAASTLPRHELARIFTYLDHGGEKNFHELLAFISHRLGRSTPWREPRAISAFGRFEEGCREPAVRLAPAKASHAPHALIILYRSAYLAADTQPVTSLADALAARGFRVTSAFVTSLKDEQAAQRLAALLDEEKPDIIVNTTAFSARLDAASVLDRADCPVIQAVLSGSSFAQWREGQRGLSAADLAMNVVLPEIDGRIFGGVLSFKGETKRHDALEFTNLVHQPEPSRVAHMADLALAWTRLRRLSPAKRRLACVLSDYPGKGGRSAYAVGLDTPQSVASIVKGLRDAGYGVGAIPDPVRLMSALTQSSPREELDEAVVSLAEYRRFFASLPTSFGESVHRAFGSPEHDPCLRDGALRFPIVRSGTLVIALQPDRGRASSRKADYHDVNSPPRHAYLAFYLWLREVWRMDAMIHCGTHGTLEWLPGKSVALSQECAPEIVLGSVPVVYPFIVNNPGEAAQAKRRIGAVTIGHLTPPLIEAGTHGGTAELESLFDEYANAQSLDRRRALLLSQAILDKAEETGLSEELGLQRSDDPMAALTKLDAWLCDLKEMRIGDGLHIFGETTPSEITGLLRALDGRFVEPGPAGAPSRGRLDVLPTGRNLFTIDPRAVPTRTAWEIGSRTASEVMLRHAQDHGEWPRSVVIDLWGSATMRTGGDDLAQALALLGVRPLWDTASTRVTGFEILPLAKLERPRVDVTLRISGLFRDVFSTQIALFDEAVRAVVSLDEEETDNPLAAAMRDAPGEAFATARVFGAAPGAYGLGLARALGENFALSREALGEAYLAETSHAYGAGAIADGVEAARAFRARVAKADAFVHVQDMEGQDLLDSDAFAEHEGGFSAAASSLGAEPALYHADTSRTGRSIVRTLEEEIARVVRGRASNPQWIEGQMRHGFRGAAEVAETVDNLFAFAALTEAVKSRHFDLVYDATCGDDEVRGFLLRANPEAARAIASRFIEAERRGFWLSRRNSSARILAEMMELGASPNVTASISADPCARAQEAEPQGGARKGARG
ncbi:MAG: cobaltochelatase subunit CobN [Hyphomicrobiales bacterium]|nr:cobaltochelatase subunit CobN [Hyphomicrobiales bacterium]